MNDRRKGKVVGGGFGCWPDGEGGSLSIDISDVHEERRARSSDPDFHWLMRFGRLSHRDMYLPQASLQKAVGSSETRSFHC